MKLHFVTSDHAVARLCKIHGQLSAKIVIDNLICRFKVLFSQRAVFRLLKNIGSPLKEKLASTAILARRLN